MAKKRGSPARTTAGTQQRRASKRRTERFLIREVATKDLDQLYRLSEHLDSINLPHDNKALRGVIQRARRSFQGQIEDPTHREYMFVLEGTDGGQVIGTSIVFAQHGHPDSPHVYFDVIDDERYSATLDRHFHHLTLRLGFSFRGPTEIGALVLDPAFRSTGLGKPLSFVRFLFMAMYRDRFRRTVLAELMPPLTKDGRSELWEHLGKHFTGLTYQEADRLSHSNKEFIVSLFPQTPIQASLLPLEVQKLIGEVGASTLRVKEMLESIGFEYSYRIDPFDGGPHFEADIDEISLVRDARRDIVSSTPLPDEAEEAILARKRVPEALTRVLVGVGRPEGPTKFKAIVAGAIHDQDEIVLSQHTRKLLGARPGKEVWSIPL